MIGLGPSRANFEDAELGFMRAKLWGADGPLLRAVVRHNI